MRLPTGRPRSKSSRTVWATGVRRDIPIIRGNSPADDIFDIAAEVDADELVIGVRKRSQTDRLIFGSVAQDIMRQSDYPMRVVPRD